MAVDWVAVRTKVYGRVEAELQKQILLADDNPLDYKDVTPDEMSDQILEAISTE